MKYKIILSLVILQTVAAVALALSFHIQFWPFELLLSFTNIALLLIITGLLGSAGAVLCFSVMRKQWQLYVVISIGLAACTYCLFFSLSAQPVAQKVSPDNAPTVTVATFNKLYSNGDLSRASNYFKQQNVDVLALQEAQTGEVEKMRDQLGFEYSHAPDNLRTGFGTIVGIISRYPIEAAETIALTNDYSLVRAVIRTAEQGDIAFYAVHLPVPMSPKLYQDRNKDADTLSKILQAETLPAVVGGDFNATILSPSLRQFNVAVSNKLQSVTTQQWPECSWYGFGEFLCVRIDHIYIPRSAQLTDARVSPDLGSDHRAVLIDFTL